MIDFLFGDTFDNFFGDIEVGKVATIAFFVCAILLILGIGRIQDHETRWEGLFHVTHAPVWALFSFLGCGWLDLDGARASIWMVVILSVYFGYIMHFKKDEEPGDPLVDIFVVLFYFVIVTAVSLIVGYHIALALDWITNEDFWAYTYWSCLITMSLLTLFQGIEMHKPNK